MKPEWEERGCKQRGCRHLFGEEGHHGDFHRRVLAYGTSQEMVDFEIELLETRKDYFGSRYYNRVVLWLPCNSGENNFNYKHGLWGTPEYQKQWKERNKDKVRLQHKQYRERNKDKVRLQQKQYYEQNKEKIALQQKQYREQNREKELLRHKQYRERNKDKVRLRQKQYRERKKLEIFEGII